MKINFTKKEYRILLDLIHIADWVLHAHSTDDRADTKDYRDLMQKLMSYAKEMGFEALVDFDKERGEYVTSGEFVGESVAEDYIEAFEDNTFWSQLIGRLSDRDAMRQTGVNHLSEIEMSERFKAIGEAEEKWITEIDNYGLSRIRIDDDETKPNVVH